MKKFLSFFTLILLLSSLVFVIAACSDKNLANNDSSTKTIELATPTNLVLENDILSWDAVENASCYRIRMSNWQNPPNVALTSEVTTEQTSFDLSLNPISERFYVWVKAIGQTVGNIFYLESYYTESILFEFLVWDGVYSLTSINFIGEIYDQSLVDLYVNNFTFIYVQNSRTLPSFPTRAMIFTNLNFYLQGYVSFSLYADGNVTLFSSMWGPSSLEGATFSYTSGSIKVTHKVREGIIFVVVYTYLAEIQDMPPIRINYV